MQLIAFNLGSLGFLTNHFYENYIRDLKGVIYGREDLEQCCLDVEDGLAVCLVQWASLYCQYALEVFCMSRLLRNLLDCSSFDPSAQMLCWQNMHSSGLLPLSSYSCLAQNAV